MVQNLHVRCARKPEPKRECKWFAHAILKGLEMFPDVDVDLNKSIHTPVGTGGYDVNTFKDTITNIS